MLKKIILSLSLVTVSTTIFAMETKTQPIPEKSSVQTEAEIASFSLQQQILLDHMLERIMKLADEMFKGETVASNPLASDAFIKVLVATPKWIKCNMSESEYLNIIKDWLSYFTGFKSTETFDLLAKIVGPSCDPRIKLFSYFNAHLELLLAPIELESTDEQNGLINMVNEYLAMNVNPANMLFINSIRNRLKACIPQHTTPSVA